MVIFLLFINCSYLQKRKKDALDVFGFQINTNTYGISTRISFLQMGVLYQSKEHKSYGFRNGATGNLDTEEFSLLFLGSERFKGLKIEENRFEEKIKDPNLTVEEKNEILNQYKEQEKKLSMNQTLNIRNKIYDVYLPFGTTKPLRKSNKMLLKDHTRFAPMFFYTEIRLNFGLYYSISVNVNIGEMLDVILGFFLIDIFSDDIE